MRSKFDARRAASPSGIFSGDVVKAIANLFWLGLERLTQIIVALVTSGVLARYFGPEIFGKWQYANTLLLVLAPITWVCGAEILVPTLVRSRDAAAAHRAAHSYDDSAPLGTILGSAFALRFSVSLAALLCTWIVLSLAPIDRMVAAMLAGLAATMVFREPFGVVSAWLQSRTYSKPALLASMGSAVVKAALVFTLARYAMSPAGFAWLWALEAAAVAAALMAYYFSQARVAQQAAGFAWHVDRALLRRFASAGAVFWLGLICMYLFLKLDRLMLQPRVGFAELGRYAAAQQLNENWITLSLMLAQTLAPAFIYRIDAYARLRRNVWRLMAMTALVMAAGAAVLDLCAPFIVARVFGPGYLSTAVIFRWAVWLSVFAGIEAIGNLVVLKYQAKYLLLGKWLGALAVAFVANLLLIPHFGVYGALGGLACGYSAAIVVNLLFIQARLRGDAETMSTR
ncbi:MAG: oligosaccharide flippase family protein [Janthinobacterium lividum]